VFTGFFFFTLVEPVEFNQIAIIQLDLKFVEMIKQELP
jgi:hypothetical protein